MHSKDRDEDEEEDFNIKPDDNLLVAGHVDEDLSSLEISGDNCYCKKFTCVSFNFYLFFSPLHFKIIIYLTKSVYFFT